MLVKPPAQPAVISTVPLIIFDLHLRLIDSQISKHASLLLRSRLEFFPAFRTGDHDIPLALRYPDILTAARTPEKLVRFALFKMKFLPPEKTGNLAGPPEKCRIFSRSFGNVPGKNPEIGINQQNNP